MAPSDPVADNSYAPYAYDALYAIAHALHVLIEQRGATSIDGDELMAALLQDVSFEGVTGRVEFYDSSTGSSAGGGRRELQVSSTLYRGDRRVGVSYSLLNYQGDDALVNVGSWTACTQSDLECSFADRWTRVDGTALAYSTANNQPPNDVELRFCTLAEHESFQPHVISDCGAEDFFGESSASAHGLAAGHRTVRFATPFGCESQGPIPVPCGYVYEAAPEVHASYIAVAVAVTLKMYMLVQLWRLRSDKKVKRMQPCFSAITLIGGVLLDATALLLPGEPTVALCSLRPAWISVAFAIFFAPLAFKTLRIWLLIVRSMGDARGSGSASNPAALVSHQKIKTTYLLVGIMLIAVVHAAIFAIYFTVDSQWPQPVARASTYHVSWNVTDSEIGSSSFSAQSTEIRVRETVCEIPLPIFFIEIGLQGLLCFATLVARCVTWRPSVVI